MRPLARIAAEAAGAFAILILLPAAWLLLGHGFGLDGMAIP